MIINITKEQLFAETNIKSIKMESYEEFSIRCKTCNNQLACMSYAYKSYLEAQSSVEEALNALGIYNPCCRIAMANPTIVTFNMENREVIEGFKSVDAAEEADVQTQNTGRPVFNSCMGVVPPAQIVNPVGDLGRLNVLNTGRIPATPQGPQVFPQPTQTGIQTIGVLQPAIQRLQPAVPMVQRIEPPVQPIIPTVDLNTMEPIGVGIPVTAPNTNKFSEPILVGVPTINTDPTVVQPTVFVGANKQVRVLNGRTYLAR